MDALEGEARRAVGGFLDKALLLGELKTTARLSFPLVGTFSGSVAISTSDVVMMGWLGPEFLAAGSLGYNLIFPLFLLGLGVILAVAPLIAQGLGAGDEKAVRRTLRQGLWASIVLGIPFSAFLWWGEELLIAFGQEAQLAALAGGYLRVVLWGLVPLFCFTALRAFLTAHSIGAPVVIVTFVALGLNILANYALMFGNFGFPRLELVGAGISTLLVDFLLFSGLLIYILRHPTFRRYELLRNFWRPDWPRFSKLFRLGVPIGLGIIAEAFFFSAMIFLSGRIGTQELAAVAIVIQIMSVVFMAPLGISHACMVRVGYYMGARRLRSGRIYGVGEAAGAAMLVNFGVLLVFALLFLLVGDKLVAYFLSPEHREDGVIVSLAASLMVSAAVLQFFDGWQIVSVGVMRGLQMATRPMALAFFAFWGLGVPVAWLLAFPVGWGVTGVWAGFGLGLFLAAALFFGLAVRVCLTFTGGETR